MSFRLVSLDMAGTTFDDDNTVYRVLKEVISEVSRRDVPQDLVDSWTGTSKLAAIRGMLEALGVEADADATFVTFSEALEQQYRENPPQLFDGVLEMFECLRASGVRVALQTGYSRRIAQLILDGADLRVGRDIDALVASDEVEASRPAPYMIFRTMEATGVTNVREVLVAGDTPNDLGAGMNAGAGFVVGVLSGAHTIDELGRLPHTHILPRITHIEQL